eukprot:scaffold33916_cov51-Attheya_sp.AAC.9
MIAMSDDDATTDKTAVSSAALPPSRRQVKPCRFHGSEKGCIKGDKCRFSHEIPAAPSSGGGGGGKLKNKTSHNLRRPAREETRKTAVLCPIIDTDVEVNMALLHSESLCGLKEVSQLSPKTSSQTKGSLSSPLLCNQVIPDDMEKDTISDAKDTRRSISLSKDSTDKKPEVSAKLKKKCKFGARCKAKRCIFRHPTDNSSATVTTQASKSPASYTSSTDLLTPPHPSEVNQINKLQDQVTLPQREKVESRSDDVDKGNVLPVAKKKKPCRYAHKCRNAHCKFLHPALKKFSTKDPDEKVEGEVVVIRRQERLVRNAFQKWKEFVVAAKAERKVKERMLKQKEKRQRQKERRQKAKMDHHRVQDQQSLAVVANGEDSKIVANQEDELRRATEIDEFVHQISVRRKDRLARQAFHKWKEFVVAAKTQRQVEARKLKTNARKQKRKERREEAEIERRVQERLKKRRHRLIVSAIRHWREFVAKQKAIEIALDRKERELQTKRDKTLMRQVLTEWDRCTKDQVESRRARRKEKLVQEQQQASLKRKNEKMKKLERAIKERNEADAKRLAFWKDQQTQQVQPVQLLVELCIADFVRQNKPSANPEMVKGSKEAMAKLREACLETYNIFFPDALHRNAKVVDTKGPHHNRTGLVRFWDEQKGKFCLGLDTKKKKAGEIVYLKPELLEPIEIAKREKKSNINEQVKERTVSFPDFLDGRSFTTKVSLRELETMKAMVATKDKNDIGKVLDACLNEMMVERDRIEKKSKELKEHLRRQKEEHLRRQKEERLRGQEEEQAEWEAGEKERDEAKKYRSMHKKKYRQAAKEQQFHGSSYPGDFFFGGSHSHFFGHPFMSRDHGIPPFWFFMDHDESDDSDDDANYGDDYRSDSRNYGDDHRSDSDLLLAKQRAHALLDVSENASLKDIKSAYRKKALQFHPDKYDEDRCGMSRDMAEDHFKEIANAYECLGNHHEQ